MTSGVIVAWAVGLVVGAVLEHFAASLFWRERADHWFNRAMELEGQLRVSEYARKGQLAKEQQNATRCEVYACSRCGRVSSLFTNFTQAEMASVIGICCGILMERRSHDGQPTRYATLDDLLK